MRLLWKVCLLIGIVVLAEGLVFFNPVDRNVWEHSYLAGWRTKHEHLIGVGRNRIILTGGSNVAFGVDSSKLQMVTQRETINVGLHGGLGLRAILNEVEDGARAGDSVIVIPEYEHFYGDLMNGERDAANLVRYDRSALRYFSSWRQWRPLVTNSYLVTRDAMFGLIDIVKMKLRGQADDEHRRPTVYRSDAFNLHGDVVAHLDQDSRPDLVAGTNEQIHGAFNQHAVDEVAGCATRLMARGVEFLFLYPPVSVSYWAVNGDLARQVAVRMPGRWARTRPEDWVFEDRLFYDTSYHLNRHGRELRTQKLLGVLPGALKRVNGRVTGWAQPSRITGRESPRHTETSMP